MKNNNSATRKALMETNPDFLKQIGETFEGTPEQRDTVA